MQEDNINIVLKNKDKYKTIIYNNITCKIKFKRNCLHKC